MKRKLSIAVLCLMPLFIYAQTIEKIGETKKIAYIGYPVGIGSFPSGIYIDETRMDLIIEDPRPNELLKVSLINMENSNVTREKRTISYMSVFIKFGEDYWGVGSGGIHPVINSVSKSLIPAHNGISFILKKGDGYIVYYVNDKGIPGAADTEGRIYGNTEAMEYLKTYDKAKYEASRKRAEELGLADSFDKADVLVWGQTYYSTAKILKAFWKPETYLYPNFGYMIQYDIQGNGYMADYDSTGTSSDITIVSPNGKQLSVIPIHNESAILRNHSSGQSFTASTYVGFGGNIYYYIAGKEYTEVFRIRRTWGEPDLYAMAVNGYTEDSYGTYVKEVLSKLSKAELRLLRNTLFALYGYTFKSEDLKSHFDKQVWYTDGNKTMSDIVLPAHRQKLLELVQAEESR